jgi:hypothetical protein
VPLHPHSVRTAAIYPHSQGPCSIRLSSELLSGTTESHLFISESQTTEFSIEKGLAMVGYSNAVMPAIVKEMKKMFVTSEQSSSSTKWCLFAS